MRRERKIYGGKKGTAGTIKQNRLTHGFMCNEKNHGCNEKIQLKCFKHTTKFIILLISAIFILSNANPILLGVNIKFLEKIEFSPPPDAEGIPWSFCVTDDDLFIIPDYKEGSESTKEMADS